MSRAPFAAMKSGAFVVVGLLLAIVAHPVRATEGGAGHYLLGSRDILSGIVPPPGDYASVDIAAVDVGVNRLTIGGAILAGAQLDAVVTRLSFTKSFAEKAFGGGRPFVSLTQPVATGRLTFDASAAGQSIRARDRATALGDPVITAGLGWDQGPTHMSFATSVFLPLGKYDKARINPATGTFEALNFGKNRLGVTPVFSITHLPPTGLELSGAAGLSFSTRNRATDYRTAPELHVEGAIAQHLSQQARIGVAGYWYQQLGEDSGRGAELFRAALGTRSLKARVFGIGPVVGYSTRLGGAPLTLKAKYTHEFGARRRLEGNIFQFSAAAAF